MDSVEPFGSICSQCARWQNSQSYIRFRGTCKLLIIKYLLMTWQYIHLCAGHRPMMYTTVLFWPLKIRSRLIWAKTILLCLILFRTKYPAHNCPHRNAERWVLSRSIWWVIRNSTCASTPASKYVCFEFVCACATRFWGASYGTEERCAYWRRVNTQLHTVNWLNFDLPNDQTIHCRNDPICNFIEPKFQILLKKMHIPWSF